MADKKPGTPLTEETLVMLVLGYVVVGPLLMLAAAAIYFSVQWALS